MKRVAVYTALAAAAAAGHVGYPIALAAVTRRRPDPRPPCAPGLLPAVTMVVPAYREAGVIAAKVRDCHANGYPGELEVLVVADGDPETAEAARAAGATVIETTTRQGKPAALNRGVAAASGDIVILSDANTELAPGSIAAMVRWFGAPDVGAVAGEKRLHGGHEGAYWAFESWLKRRENRLGTTIGLDGALAAVRRSSWHAIPTDEVIDDFWLALSVMAAGERVIYEPGASSAEAPPADRREDWERRTRVVGGAIRMLWRRRELLGPRHPVIAFEVWGHRAWRMTGGPLAHAVLLAAAVREATRQGPLTLPARAMLAGHVVAGLGWLAGERAPALVRSAGHVLYLQAVGWGGMLRLARGPVAVTWRKAAR